MNNVVSGITELLKILSDSFRLASLFPAIVFIWLNRLLVAPHLESVTPVKEVISQDFWDQTLFLGLLAVILGYTLNAIEVSIVRLYEGYPWRHTQLGRLLTAWHRYRFDTLHREIDELDRKLMKQLNQIPPGQQNRLADQLDHVIKVREIEVANQFPQDSAQILPTRLGNVIAAFESYPGQKYGMDGVSFWPRMLPVLATQKYLPYINQARSTLDFLLNISLLMAILGLEFLMIRIVFTATVHWVFPVVAFLASWLFYQAAIQSVGGWAAFFKAGFDLFRYHLAILLGLTVASSFVEEKKRWEKLTQFWNSIEPTAEYSHFHYDGQNWPANIEKKE